MNDARQLVAVGVAVITAALTAAVPEAAAIETLGDAFSLDAPDSLERAKRRAAREDGSWEWTMLGRLATAYDTNIHRTPEQGADPVDGSALFRANAAAELLHYFDGRHRLSLRAETKNAPRASDTDTVSEYSQAFIAGYSHRINDANRAFLSFSVRHANDSQTRIDGEEFTRDFEHISYRLLPTLRHEVSDWQTLRVGYYAKRKDYSATPGLTSLDWWKHGPLLEYEIEPVDDLAFTAGYRFTAQSYDSEIAAGRDGNDDPGTGNPPEEHFFHQLSAEVEWDLVDWLGAEAGYAFIRKDDRFRNFESYDAHEASVRIGLLPSDRWLLEVEADYRLRFYDNRPEDPNAPTADKLEYDRIRVGFNTRFDVTEHTSLFAHYVFSTLESNRETGDAYRDYTRHFGQIGVGFAY